MSWKFAGIIFEKNYAQRYADLLGRLGVQYSGPAAALTFAQAIGRQNQGTALGTVNDKTLLLDHLLPYDCSYEPDEDGPLDEHLRALSCACDILNYIVDGVSGTYCFTIFRQGERIRRWAAEPGHLLCDDGTPLAVEGQESDEDSTAQSDLPAIFAVSEYEAHLFAVWEAFLGVSFQDLVNDDRQQFQCFF